MSGEVHGVRPDVVEAIEEVLGGRRRPMLELNLVAVTRSPQCAADLSDLRLGAQPGALVDLGSIG